MEALEDRSVPSTVMNLLDSGPGSLRQAILDTPAGGTVEFQSGLTGTIPLTSGELAISQNLTISGPGAGVITVSGNNARRVFEVLPGAALTLSGLTITQGSIGGTFAFGGGIFNSSASALTVVDCNFTGNSAQGFLQGAGGGIYSAGGAVTVIGCLFTRNSATDSGTRQNGNGGAIFTSGTLAVEGCTFTSNSASGKGGGISGSGDLTVRHSTFTLNTAPAFGGGDGGAIDSEGGLTVALTVSGCTFTGNSVGSGLGGAIFSRIATVADSTFTANTSTGGGGIFGSRTLTVTGCTFTGNSAAGELAIGGGIDADALTATDCTFAGNSAVGTGSGLASGQGGGVYAGAVTVIGCTFTGNSAIGTGNGAGGGLVGNTITATGCTFTANLATGPDNGVGLGGGIFNFGTAEVTGCTLSRNRAAGSGSGSGQGGGILNSGTLTVTRTDFLSNSATATGPQFFQSGSGQGGGIFNRFGTQATVTMSDFIGNSATATNSGFASGGSGQGGGIYNGSATLTLDRCTFASNTASAANTGVGLPGSGQGGGIYNVGTLTVSTCTLSGNTATGGGGGIYDDSSGRLTVSASTLSGNSVSGTILGSGGGIAINTGGMLTLGNTIVAGNTALASPDVAGALSSQGHNLIGNTAGGSGFAASDLLNVDPLLGSLQDNGGPTQTMALLPGSPALNAGDPALLGTADQRGVVRRGGVNIGAYQASASAFVLTAPAPATAGAPFDLAVTAVDAFGQTAVGYTGTVTFQTTDTRFGVVLPANYSFTSADAGMHTFTGATTLVTAGSQTVTATDTADGSIAGFAAVTVDPAAATQLVLSDSSNPVKGQAWSLTVTAYDAFGNVATGYRGTVTFSSSDDKATLPADYTFTAADAGTRTFGVTFHRLRQQSLTVTDTLDASIFGMIDVVVQNPGQGGH